MHAYIAIPSLTCTFLFHPGNGLDVAINSPTSTAPPQAIDQPVSLDLPIHTNPPKIPQGRDFA